uniref:C2H2-type domain-containing protein n=1 Tax=viral metagenome TaxID=1070528 RepID=A0A6C0F8U2_9ZZZZ
MDNKMDNFSKQRKQQKSEKDQISFEKKSLKKKKIDNVESLTLNEFDMIKNTYGSYYCSDCDFDTKNLKDYKRHLTTKKHFFLTPKKTPNRVSKKVSQFICDCGNRYEYASGLSKHRLKCKNKKKVKKKSKKSKKSGENGENFDKNATKKCKNGQKCKKQNFAEKKVLTVTNEFQHIPYETINNNKNFVSCENIALNEFETIKNKYGSYYCTDCDFDTKNLKDYKRHLTTKKHLFGVPILTPKFVTKKVSLFVCGCGNSYKYASGLSKHRIKCKNKKINKIPKKTVTVNTFHNKHNEMNHGNKKFVSGEIEIVEIMKQTLNQTETINKLLEQNSVLIEKLSEKPTNNITYQNCGNKKMTINVFLNEKCKDAMNLTDFVNNMNISLEDLMYTKNYGYNKGISNIFVKHLKDLQPSERPIHCSDKKRMQFYVRDENKWLKDEKNEKIDKSIHDLSIKQIKHLKEWEMQNPHYLQDEKLLSQWQQLIHEIMGPSDDSTREKDKESIMKTLGNTVELKDSLIIPMKD